MTALISGEADIGLMGPEASIYVYKQGSDDYAINFAQLTKRDGSFIVSREKNDNFSYEDMKGKEILWKSWWSSSNDFRIFIKK